MSREAAMPKLDMDAENSEHLYMMQGYKVIPCMEYQIGECCNRNCFHYHDERSMRRPVLDSSGHLKYWDEMCEFVVRGQPCPYGYGCPFSHTENERLYHPGQFKSTISKSPSSWEASSKKDRRANAFKFRRYEPMPAPQEVVAPMSQPVTPGIPSCQKLRLCAYFPNVDQCRREEFCSFAHSRDEITAPLLTEKEEEKLDLSAEFFTTKFKIHWCPIGVQHDWQTCVYAHNYQDARRDPSIGYGPRPCPYWEKKDRAPSYQARCPNGFACPYAHGAKEQLYHPCYFKTVVCWDFNQGKKRCPRGQLCAFFHRKKLQRKSPDDLTNYEVALTEENMRNLQAHFRNPPFFSDEREAMGMPPAPVPAPAWPMQVPQMCIPIAPPGFEVFCGTPQTSPMHGFQSPEGTPMYAPRLPNGMPSPMSTPMVTPMGSPMHSSIGTPIQAQQMMIMPVFSEEQLERMPPMMMYPVDVPQLGLGQMAQPISMVEKRGHIRMQSQTTAEGSSHDTDKSDGDSDEKARDPGMMDSLSMCNPAQLSALADLNSRTPFFVDE
jgi:hypothetical protein